jgi:hypothetical protein
LTISRAVIASDFLSIAKCKFSSIDVLVIHFFIKILSFTYCVKRVDKSLVHLNLPTTL